MRFSSWQARANGSRQDMACFCSPDFVLARIETASTTSGDVSQHFGDVFAGGKRSGLLAGSTSVCRQLALCPQSSTEGKSATGESGDPGRMMPTLPSSDTVSFKNHDGLTLRCPCGGFDAPTSSLRGPAVGVCGWLWLSGHVACNSI